jgi:tetratricopeptide (TPR) repeat protein
VVLTSRLKNKSVTILIWLLAILTLGYLTIQRNQVYQTAFGIWQDVVQKSPGNARAHDNLGVALAELGRLDEAISQEMEAIRLKPNFAEAHQHLGTMKSEQGKSGEAIHYFEKAIEYKPDLASAYRNIGLELIKQGKTEEAYGFFEKGLKINPYMEIAWRSQDKTGEFLQKENN